MISLDIPNTMYIFKFLCVLWEQPCAGPFGCFSGCLSFFFFLNLSFVVKGCIKTSEATQVGSPKWNWFDPELSLKYFSYALQSYAKNNFLRCKGKVFKLQPAVKKAGTRDVVSPRAPLCCWKGVWCNWKGGHRRQPRGSYLSPLVPCVEVEGNGHSEVLQGGNIQMEIHSAPNL